MCGIGGILYADAARPVSHGLLSVMAGAIAHRGPDAEGIWSAPGVGLAHRRLSIIDLAGGDQPIGNEDGSIQVVFNGEIYNYQTLRRQLESRGHRFATNSDTEVLVHLYEERGAELVEQLRGMFAFALWDGARRRLVLARDRVGQKPLYVYRDGEKLLFGSELKALLAHGDVDRELDPAALEDYFCYGVVPGERSIFKRIRKLPAAHTWTVHASDWHSEPRRYWRFVPRIDESRTVEDWQEAIRAKVEETVRAHLIADVPVGAFLSGGIDSSVMVATMARLGVSPLRTFSIGFQDERFSELPYARETAREYGCEHVEEIVTPEAVSSLDDLVHFYDEPFADSSAIPTLHVCRLAARHVKVVLSGDGGDEAFGGYRRYAHDVKEATVRSALPSWLRRGLIGTLARHWPRADWLPRVLRAKTALTNLSLAPNQAYANSLSIARMPMRRELLSADVRAELNGHRPEQIVCDAYSASQTDDPLASMITADIGMLLPDDFLTKVDRACMSCGLEARPPLVDHELLELTGQIPSRWKIHGGETKWIFKEAFRERLPASIRSRPKQGFEIPVDEWLRGPLRDVFEQTVLAPGSEASPYLNSRESQRLYRSHRAGTGRHGNVLWSLLVFARWAASYLRTPIHAE